MGRCKGNFTDEELVFIIHYDIKYYMGQESWGGRVRNLDSEIT